MAREFFLPNSEVKKLAKLTFMKNWLHKTILNVHEDTAQIIFSFFLLISAILSYIVSQEISIGTRLRSIY